MFFVRHWGALLACIGILIASSAYVPQARSPLLALAAFEKLLIGLLIFFGPLKRTLAMTAVAAADGHTISAYGIDADSHNNLYALDFTGHAYADYVWVIDRQTGAFSMYPVPTYLSRPRRGRFDANDRLWFGEYDGNNIGMFDSRTKTYTEWPMPEAFTFPYDVVPDRTGHIWTGSEFTDRVVRLDPATGKSVSYLLPRSTNIRRVFVDDSTTPVTLWVGSNLRPALYRVSARRLIHLPQIAQGIGLPGGLAGCTGFAIGFHSCHISHSLSYAWSTDDVYVKANSL